jgi:hypothetical protein
MDIDRLREELRERMGGAVTVALELCAFGRIASDEDARGIVAAWQAFEREYRDKIRWQDYGSGKWRKVSKQTWTRLPQRIASAASRKKEAVMAYTLHAGNGYQDAEVPAFEFLYSDDSQQFGLRWLADDRSAEALVERARALLPSLPLDWGYGGWAVYGPGYSDATQGIHDAVGDALNEHPLLGQAHPISWGTTELGLCNLGWLTILGERFLEALGGASRAQPEITSLGLTSERVGTSLLVRAGQEPRPGPELAKSLRRLWAYFAPLRPSAEELADSWVAGLTLEEMTEWARRWERG